MKKITLLLMVFALLSLTEVKAQEPNAYAYDLKVVTAFQASTQTVQVGYRLNVVAGNVEFIVNGCAAEVVSSQAGTTPASPPLSAGPLRTATEHRVWLKLKGYSAAAAAGNLEWSIRVTRSGTVTDNAGTKIGNPGQNSSQFCFNFTRGLAVDNHLDSPYMGSVYVTEGYGGTNVGGVRNTSTGIYILRPDLIEETTAAGLRNSPRAITAGNFTTTVYDHSPGRISVAPGGGRLYLSESVTEHRGVWWIDWSNPDTGLASTKVFSGTETTNPPVMSSLVKGTGNDRKLYTLDFPDVSHVVYSNPTARWYTYTNSSHLRRYSIPNDTQIGPTSGTSVHNSDIVIWNQEFGSSLIEGKGGIWMIQRNSNTTARNTFIYFTDNTISTAGGTGAGDRVFAGSALTALGVPDNAICSGIAAASPDGKFIASVRYRGHNSNINPNTVNSWGSNIIDVFELGGYSGDIPSTLTYVCQINNGQDVNEIAFDWGNNLYAVSNLTERLSVYAVARNTTTPIAETPAHSSKRIAIPTNPWPAMNGTYYIPSVTCDGVHFPDLKTACDAINTAITGNVTLIVNNNLTGQANATITNNTAYNITIKSDATKRSMAFTGTGNNITVNGTGTGSLTIDNLIITSSAATGSIVNFNNTAANLTVNNCNITNTSTGSVLVDIVNANNVTIDKGTGAWYTFNNNSSSSLNQAIKIANVSNNVTVTNGTITTGGGALSVANSDGNIIIGNLEITNSSTDNPSIKVTDHAATNPVSITNIVQSASVGAGIELNNASNVAMSSLNIASTSANHPAIQVANGNGVSITNSSNITGGAGAVLIDSSNDVTMNNLTIGSNSATAPEALVAISNGSNIVDITNCAITGGAESKYAILLGADAGQSLPKNVTITQSTIKNEMSNLGQAIAVDPSTGFSGKAEMLVIKNNTLISGKHHGIVMKHVDGAAIEKNNIRVNNANISPVRNVGVWANEGVSGQVSISKNRFIQLASANADGTGQNGVSAIVVDSGEGSGPYFIENNFFTNFDKLATYGGKSSIRGLYLTGGGASILTPLYYVRHNTFYMNELKYAFLPEDHLGEPTADDPAYAAITLDGTVTNETANIKNNLFVSNETDVPNFFFIASGFTLNGSDNNVFSLPVGGGGLARTIPAAPQPGGLRYAAQVVDFVEPGDCELGLENASLHDASLVVFTLKGGSPSPVAPDNNNVLAKQYKRALSDINGVTTDINDVDRTTVTDKDGESVTFAGAFDSPSMVGDITTGIDRMTAGGINVICLGNQITVISPNLKIQSVKLFDAQGRLLATDSESIVCSVTAPAKGIYIVETVTESGRNITKVAVK